MRDLVPSTLVLYNATQTYTNTVWDHAASFALFSSHRIFYAHLDSASPFDLNLSNFDVVVLHYTVRLPFDQISPSCAAALRAFPGVKVVFQQDEYDFTEKLRRWLQDLGIDVMFTCVPSQHVPEIYDPSRFPDTLVMSNLTGYVPLDLPALPQAKPFAERKNYIGYRGRSLPYWYGDLSQEKFQIGERMHAECKQRGLSADIASTERDRIYGAAWYAFMGDCRATLGSESGSNVFDDDGSIRAGIRDALARDKSLTYADVKRLYLADHEKPGLMNQISPRIFEAIALRTALVLFEGEYSGIIRPGEHYIELKKDFSNVSDVLDAVQNIDLLERITERAYVDVIQSGIASYPRFISMVDAVISKCLAAPSKVGVGAPARDFRDAQPLLLSTLPLRAPIHVRGALHPSDQHIAPSLIAIWSMLPERMRNRLRPFALLALRAKARMISTRQRTIHE